MKWIKRLFSNKSVKNIYHADFKDKCILAYTLDGVDYYRFKDELDIPYGRYVYLSTFLQAVELRMDLETLKKYISLLQGYLSGGKGRVDIGASIITLKQMETRTSIILDQTHAYNLASVIFFTEDEPLNVYSIEHNKKKIAAWREAQAIDFFTLMPMRELLGLPNISTQDLLSYLTKTKPIVEDLNSVMLQATNKELSTQDDVK
jgi:hypothetical protein